MPSISQPSHNMRLGQYEQSPSQSVASAEQAACRPLCRRSAAALAAGACTATVAVSPAQAREHVERRPLGHALRHAQLQMRCPSAGRLRRYEGREALDIPPRAVRLGLGWRYFRGVRRCLAHFAGLQRRRRAGGEPAVRLAHREAVYSSLRMESQTRYSLSCLDSRCCWSFQHLAVRMSVLRHAQLWGCSMCQR